MLSPNFFYAVVPHGLRNKKNCVYRIVILYMHMYIHREKNLSSKLENSYLIYSKYLLCLRMIISIFPQNNVSINRKQIFVEDNIAFSLSFLESFTSTTLKYLFESIERERSKPLQRVDQHQVLPSRRKSIRILVGCITFFF